MIVKRKKKKPLVLTIRLPRIRQTGGAHTPAKGGKHRRNLEKEKNWKEIRAEFE